MAKKIAKPEIEPKCDYCVHNKGETKQFKYMYLCECLGYCVPFGMKFCEAYKKMKGDFKMDNNKYKEYLNRQKEL
ncbi:hypothetical protein [Dysgonomonas massiliensis]|uniref:hypothetical protein n=1 Tax=Dysgonomonas massiliensis TaxID=2040292 RepID=UPI000C75AACC|nr:hypothetical protein [Dysgonomonas massiliensis]